MQAYIFQADIFCGDCGRDICSRLTPPPEEPYDSDDYPKGPFGDGGGESDTPQHCGSGEDCLNAIELTDGSKVGAWLENPLTGDGADYVREAVESGGEVAGLWAGWYADELS